MLMLGLRILRCEHQPCKHMKGLGSASITDAIGGQGGGEGASDSAAAPTPAAAAAAAASSSTGPPLTSATGATPGQLSGMVLFSAAEKLLLLVKLVGQYGHATFKNPNPSPRLPTLLLVKLVGWSGRGRVLLTGETEHWCVYFMLTCTMHTGSSNSSRPTAADDRRTVHLFRAILAGMTHDASNDPALSFAAMSLVVRENTTYSPQTSCTQEKPQPLNNLEF